MSKILKAIAILFVITAVVTSAGCLNNSSNQNSDSQNNITTAQVQVPTPAPTPSDPQLAISPDEKFPGVITGGSPVNDKVTMKSVLGDAYNISLIAYPEDEKNHLSVKVDEIEGAPFLSDKILKGNKQYVNVSIEASNQCATGNHTISLKANYHDITNQEYQSSSSIIVNVEQGGLVGIIDQGKTFINKQI